MKPDVCNNGSGGRTRKQTEIWCSKLQRLSHQVDLVNPRGNKWIMFLFLLCMSNLLFMHYYCLITLDMEWSLELSSYIDNCLGVSFDVLVLFLLTHLLLLWKKTKTAISICFIVTWIWSFANVMYSRFFHHYITLSAVSQTGTLFDSLMLDCIVSELRLFDLYYVAIIPLYISMYKRLSLAKMSVKKVFQFFLCILVADILAHGITSAFCHVDRKVEYAFYRLYNRHINQTWQFLSPNYAGFHRGSVRTLVYELKNNIQGIHKLSENETKQIKEYISDSHPTFNHPNLTYTNIIIILVESYMSFISDMKVSSGEVTPFLNTLKRDSTTYYNGCMRENVTIGESSDGQFIYMTGLLPLRAVITVSKARKICLPGLPKKLGKKSRMIIPTIASMWNQDDMCRQYNFNSLYTCRNYMGASSNLNDEQVFQLAMQKDIETDIPFFSVVLTMSMHQPYTKQIDPTFPVADSSIPKDLACYLNVCHYTDRQIERYFEHLKRTGLYDNSLIVIAADHPVHNTDFGGVSKNIPLYIVNIPDDIRERMWHGECNQIDVYTTLLDLLGVESDWYGLGHSLLSPNYSNVIDSRKWDVSEWIIRGDYFSK